MRGKIFTRDEADRMLPLVRRIVVNARARQRLLLRKQDEIARQLSRGREEDGDVQLRALKASCERLRKDLDRYTAELEQLGCFLRDAETGIVECYAEHGGRIVYLTWLPPARRYEWFHSVETSYVQRLPLPDAPAEGVRGATER